MSKNTDSVEELLPCPGKRLKMAREAKGMDAAQAAEQLHLSRAMVNALEAEDYDRLPARVFVRGYYRNYARLMEVPEEIILQEFEDRCPDAVCRAAPAITTRRIKSQVSSNHRLVRLVTWLVIIALVAMLVVWWKGNFNWPDMPGMSDLPGMSEVAKPQTTDYQQESSSVGEDSSTTTEEMVEDVIPAMPDSRQQPAEEIGMPAESADASDNEPAPAAVEPKPVQAPVIAEISVPVKPELTVLFSGDCWVDIRDSTRQFKIFGKMTDGDMRKLGGEPPYKMVFGNYPVAKLLVDGKPYDLSAHANGVTAKFTFDPATAVTR
jgi:cytoskeleton protein RodZ